MPAGRVALRILAVVLGALWLFAAFVAGSFTGWSSERVGWLWSALAFATGLAVAVLIWSPRDRRRPLIAVAAVSLVLGFVHWQTSPPTHGRIAEAADEVRLPAGWQLQHDTLLGNTWCFKGCPQIDRTYAAPGSYDDAVTSMTAAFEAAGWQRGGDAFDTATFSDGRWRAVLFEGYPPGEPTEVTISFTG